MNSFNTKKEWKFDGTFLDYLANFPSNAVMASAVSEYSRNGKTAELEEMEKMLDPQSLHLYWYLCRDIDNKKRAYEQAVQAKQAKEQSCTKISSDFCAS